MLFFVSKSVKDEPDEEIRICALQYLPYLIYFLGVSSNSLVFKLIHPTLNEEKSLKGRPSDKNSKKTECNKKCEKITNRNIRFDKVDHLPFML